MDAEAFHVPDFDECEILVYAAAGGGYTSEVQLGSGERYIRPAPLAWGAPEMAKLREAVIDPFAYGTILFESFLNGPPREGLAVARKQAERAGHPLRIKLNIAPDAAQLHALTWEYLYDPNTDTAFAAHPEMAFARYFPSVSPLGEPVSTNPLRILAVIADASDLDTYGLLPLKPDIERAKLTDVFDALKDQAQYEFLEGLATPQNIRDTLEKGHHHVLHILGHGKFINDKGYLILANAEGKAQPVAEDSFGDLFLGLDDVRLIVLASCFSATRSESSAFLGVAPNLVSKGVPAVVAMQRQVDPSTAQIFTDQFYRNLSRHGIVDAAVNAARYRLYYDGDRRPFGTWAVPVVFQRVERGQLFYPAPADLSMRLPPNLRDRFFAVLHQFVDREEQRTLFANMVNRSEVSRILYIHGGEGMGKTWFLERCAAWCSEHEHTWCSVDFERKEPWDYLRVLNRLVPEGADAAFSDYSRLVEQLRRAGPSAPEDEETRLAVTAEYVQALTRLDTKRPTIFLIDTLDRAPDLVHKWLLEEFLPWFQDRTLSLRHITVVCAAPEPSPFRDKNWYQIATDSELQPLTAQHFVEYARRRGFNKYDEAQLRLLFIGIAAAQNISPDVGLTPYQLSVTLDNLSRQLSRM